MIPPPSGLEDDCPNLGDPAERDGDLIVAHGVDLDADSTVRSNRATDHVAGDLDAEHLIGCESSRINAEFDGGTVVVAVNLQVGDGFDCGLRCVGHMTIMMPLAREVNRFICV